MFRKANETAILIQSGFAARNKKTSARRAVLPSLALRVGEATCVVAAAKTPHEKTVHEAQIAATDRQIDRLVYELYGLTADEIKIVEEGTAS